MPGGLFVSPGDLVFDSNFLENVSMSSSTLDAQFRTEFKQTKYDMTEAEFVSLRRAEMGLEPFIPAKTTGDPEIVIGTDDDPYQREYEAGSFSMTLNQYVSLRRAEDGKEAFLP